MAIQQRLSATMIYWDVLQPDAEERERSLYKALLLLWIDLALVGYQGWSKPEKIVNENKINSAVPEGSIAYILYDKSRFKTTTDAYRFGTTDLALVKASLESLESTPEVSILEKARKLQNCLEILQRNLQHLYEQEISITSDRDEVVRIDNLHAGGILERAIQIELDDCIAAMQEDGHGVWKWEYLVRQPRAQLASILMYQGDALRDNALSKLAGFPKGNINEIQKLYSIC